MFNKKISFIVATLILGASCLWAGDIASFVDLGFSPDGRTYMFAQYGIQAKTLKPWADLYVVDVPQNNFVAGGRVSYVHDSPANAGQDGSGALYRVISRNTALADRYGINFLIQGLPLYISLSNDDVYPGPGRGENIEFRDFEQNASYKASLVPVVQGSGASLKSSFSISLERTGRDGTRKTYTVGTPQLQRPLIDSYRIRRVITAPRDGLIFVIETRKLTDEGYDIRFMIETLKL
ncbi:hypothetical protein FACS1894151_04420 [Spirochaetia bacterium]|nr:hypothetical protein FACS1894151_04420 [Spirochaetia bacterium]